MRLNFYEHFTEAISGIFPLKIFRTWYLMWLFYTPICCSNFWALGFALYLRKTKIFPEALLYFSRKPHSVFQLKTKFCNFKHCFKNKLYLPIPHFSHLSATCNKCVSLLLLTCFPPSWSNSPASKLFSWFTRFLHAI